jgi:hypothetical protein
MRLISSKRTWWHKRAFPAIWFGILGLVTLIFIPSVIDGETPPGVLLIPVGMSVFGYVLMWLLVFRMMDAVWIDGDDLVVRNRGEEERFPIGNIVDVEGSFLTNPEHIKLTVKPPSRFGETFRFLPPGRWLPFGWHPVARELMDRSRSAERGRAGAPR